MRLYTNPEVAQRTGLELSQVRAIATVRGVLLKAGRHLWTKKQLDELLTDLDRRDEQRAAEEEE